MDSNSTQQDGTSTDTGLSGGSTASTPVTAFGPDDVQLTTVLYIDENFCHWPSGFKLDIDLDNWEEWSLKITLKARQRGFTKWLNGSLPQPSATTHAHAHRIWAINDQSTKDFILSHVSQKDYRSVSHLPTSHAVFEGLRKNHKRHRLRTRFILFKKAMEIRSRPDIPLSQTADEIKALYDKIVDMGPIDDDELKSILLLNALSDNFEDIQSELLSIADDPSFSSITIERRLFSEVDLMCRRAERNRQAFSALAARGLRPVCTNCNKPGHFADFCVRSGGRMAGRSINDACAAQRLGSYHS